VEAGPSLRLLPFLSPAEREALAGLRFPKRRREWLLGRWTAKHLLKRACPEYASLPLAKITVGNDPDGAPYLAIANQGRLSHSLSISHRHNRAFCAILAPPTAPPPAEAAIDAKTPSVPLLGMANTVGADIEQVYPRDPAFVRDYFTSGEAERVWAAPEALRNTLVTVLWSAKEAVLKVLRLGLTVDTRRVELYRIAGLEPHSGSVGLLASDAWLEIRVHCTLPDPPPLCAWWRPMAGDVLTLAAINHPDHPPHPRARPV
jgi:4'-phosphopantetheinyl transferase